MLRPELRAPVLASVALLASTALTACGGGYSTGNCYDATIGDHSQTVTGEIKFALTDPARAAIPESELHKYKGLHSTAVEISSELVAQHVEAGDGYKSVMSGDQLSFCIDKKVISPNPEDPATIAGY